MTIPKSFIAIFVVLIGAIWLSTKSCRNSPELSDNHTIDSITKAHVEYEAIATKKAAADSVRIDSIQQKADSIKAELELAQTRLQNRTNTLAAVNGRYKEVRAQRDTLQQLMKADSLSEGVDDQSTLIAQQKKEIDRLNATQEKLREAKDQSITNYEKRVQILNTSQSALRDACNDQHARDMADVLKVKKKAHRGEVVAWGVAAVMTVLMAIKK